MAKINKDLWASFNILGYSCLVGCASITLYMLLRIATQGYFLASEPDFLILYVEITSAIFSLAYSLILFKRFFGGKK